MIFQAVMMAKVFDVPRFAQRMIDVRIQAIGVAHACRWLGMASRLGEGWGFLAGLMRDLGKVTLLAIVAQRKASEAVPPEAIDELLAIRHAAVGAVVAERLKLPEPITRAVALHHDFNPASRDDRLPTMVAAGELLWAAAFEGRPEAREALSNASATRCLALDPPWLDRLVERMADAVPACVAAAR